MGNEPWFVGGTGRFDTDVIRATGGRIVAKAGAEAVHCDALLDAGLGLALKVVDGGRRATAPATLAVLEALEGARTRGAGRAAPARADPGHEHRRARRRRRRRAPGLAPFRCPDRLRPLVLSRSPFRSNHFVEPEVEGIVVDFFLRRPIMASVFSLVILLLGIISIPTLPIAQYPNIAPPTVTVTAHLSAPAPRRSSRR